jgi:hypothetical protein
MQFAIGVTALECSFVKHSCGPLGVKLLWSNSMVLGKKHERRH